MPGCQPRGCTPHEPQRRGRRSGTEHRATRTLGCHAGLQGNLRRHRPALRGPDRDRRRFIDRQSSRMLPRLSAHIEHWPLAAPFRIARGVKSEAVVVVAEVHGDGGVGRGESVPYARNGETPAGVITQIETLGARLSGELTRAQLSSLLPAAAARNAADCALWVLGARLIVDPNESWSFELLERLQPFLRDARVVLLEQPLPASADERLEGLTPLVPVCADESVHTLADLERVRSRYQVVNIKLDKAGGLTEALRVRSAARERGLGIMVGCMVCTSLGIAPALHLAAGADFVDLDGPWWLTRDREGGARITCGTLQPPARNLW